VQLSTQSPVLVSSRDPLSRTAARWMWPQMIPSAR
jgi:hypothetical protein